MAELTDIPPPPPDECWELMLKKWAHCRALCWEAEQVVKELEESAKIFEEAIQQTLASQEPEAQMEEEKHS